MNTPACGCYEATVGCSVSVSHPKYAGCGRSQHLPRPCPGLTHLSCEVCLLGCEDHCPCFWPHLYGLFSMGQPWVVSELRSEVQRVQCFQPLLECEPKPHTGLQAAPHSVPHLLLLLLHLCCLLSVPGVVNLDSASGLWHCRSLCLEDPPHTHRPLSTNLRSLLKCLSRDACWIGCDG